MTELTNLTIAPKHSWRVADTDNPLICTIKLHSEHAIVETVLSDEDMESILSLVSHLVSEAAVRNVAEFQAAVTLASGDKKLIDQEVMEDD